MNWTSADELKQLFAEESSALEKYHNATLKALDRIETGAILQNKLVAEIRRIEAKENDSTRPNEPMLILNGKGKVLLVN